MIRNTIRGSTLRNRIYYSTYKGRTRKVIRPLENTINETETIIPKPIQPNLFSTWWNTVYMNMIENSNEFIKRVIPNKITELYDTINTFLNTLNEPVIYCYHITFQLFSPNNEIYASSYIYIATTTCLYNMVATINIIDDKANIAIPPFRKVISYSLLSSDTWNIINTQPQSTVILQPLQMENGFQNVFQQIKDFEALFHNNE